MRWRKTTKTVDLGLRLVGENLRHERRAAGLTQEELAEWADLAPRTIQKIEAGRIPILITTLRHLRMPSIVVTRRFWVRNDSRASARINCGASVS